MNKNAYKKRVWLFHGLVVITAILMLVSFTLPWWTAYISAASKLGDSIRIYGYGLRHSLVQLRIYVQADETPFYQNVLAWVYMAVSIGLILFSMRLTGRRVKLLLGGIGLIYIVYVSIAVFVVIANRTGEFGISLQGWSTLDAANKIPAPTSVHSSLRLGYYLAYIAGGMCIALSLFRDIMTGKPALKESIALNN